MRAHDCTPTELGTVSAIDALSDILGGIRRDVARSRQVLNGAFGQIASRFAQVHAIAVAAEAREPDSPDETLSALRKVVDALTIELQFEDLLSQLLDHVQGKVEAIGIALVETRAMMIEAHSGMDDSLRQALEVLARTVKSIELAADSGSLSKAGTGCGSVDLF